MTLSRSAFVVDSFFIVGYSMYQAIDVLVENLIIISFFVIYSYGASPRRNCIKPGRAALVFGGVYIAFFLNFVLLFMYIFCYFNISYLIKYEVEANHIIYIYSLILLYLHFFFFFLFLIFLFPIISLQTLSISQLVWLFLFFNLLFI